MSEPDVRAEDLRRYRAALKRRSEIQREWRRLGSPILAAGSEGRPIEHPLMRLLAQYDRLLDRLSVPLRRVHRGPEPRAVISPSLSESPASKLRRLK